ncbi:MAG: substrate-binding domain-containing protein [Lachnospiraceae bacterium]|nr:substrate-binding domain-containing protein [Lachnospiraceae bacterium]
MEKKNISLKLIVVLLVLTLLMTIGSIVALRLLMNSAQSPGGSRGTMSYDRHYAFIHKGADEDLWAHIYDGARARGEELGVYVEDFGAQLTVDYDRDELIRIAVDADVDGIIVDGEADEEMSDAIAYASSQGIPVVTALDDCAESDRVCFVGFSNYTVGRQYGEELLKGDVSDGITVYVVMDNENAGGANLVISGIYDEFAERGVADICNIEGVYVNNETTFTAEEDIRDIFINGSLPDAMVAINSVYTRCLFQAAVDYNKAGSVALYGFDDSVDILEAVSKNLLEATVSVDSSRIGASAVDALEEYTDTGYVTTYIAQDTEVILAAHATELLSQEDEESE